MFEGINFFDIIIMSIIAISVIAGTLKGAVFTFINILKILTIFLATLLLMPFASELVEEYSKKYVNIISFVVSFLVSYGFCSILYSLLSDYIKDYTGGLIDRLFGLAIGVIRGGIYIFVIFVTIIVFSSGAFFESENAWKMLNDVKGKSYPKVIKNSKSYSYLDNFYGEFIEYSKGSFIETYLADIIMQTHGVDDALKLEDDISNRSPGEIKINDKKKQDSVDRDPKSGKVVPTKKDHDDPASTIIDIEEDDIDSLVKDAF